jgi:hypothetical protein
MGFETSYSKQAPTDGNTDPRGNYLSGRAIINSLADRTIPNWYSFVNI